MHGVAFAHPARIQQIAVDVVVGLEDVVEQIGVFGPIAGHEGIVEEDVLDLARLGRIAGRAFHRLPEHHEGRGLLVGELGNGRDDASPGDDEQVVDAFGVDVSAGVHEIAALDHGASVGRPLQVEEINAAVRFHVDVLQEGSGLEASVVGFDLVAGAEQLGLDEQSAGLEPAKTPVAIEDAAVVLDQPGALVALAGQHLAGGARLAVGA